MVTKVGFVTSVITRVEWMVSFVSYVLVVLKIQLCAHTEIFKEAEKDAYVFNPSINVGAVIFEKCHTIKKCEDYFIAGQILK